MVRVHTPTLFSALNLGSFWLNASLTTLAWAICIYCASPTLYLLDVVRLPWQPYTVDFRFLICNLIISCYLGKYSIGLARNAATQFILSWDISQSKRLYYGLTANAKGELIGEFLAILENGTERTFTYKTALKEFMDDDVFKQAQLMRDQRTLLTEDAVLRVKQFTAKARRAVMLLIKQGRNSMTLEADQAMFDKMVADHLYFMSRYCQMQSTTVVRNALEQEMNRLQKTALEGKSLSGKEMDRLMFLKARLVQLDQLAELMGATHHEVHRMEDRMAIILDALNLDGHTGILEERMYLPSPLLAELQSITWGTEKVTSEV